MHLRAHDNTKTEKRGSIIITRGLKISSAALGLSGECDVVEFHKSKNGVPLNGYEGLYLPYPIEYKKGKSKLDNCDRLQLCAQALALEEMLGCKIPKGALFYGELKRREEVVFDEALTNEVVQIVAKMHEMFARKVTPPIKKTKACRSCSLNELCLPSLTKKQYDKVSDYMSEYMKEEHEKTS